jgi:hypothetical protein
VRWGLADFRFRFGRDAEGMWLPETAANDETLDTLIEEGVRYTILSPRQAKRVRVDGERAWLDVDESTAPTGRACRYRHRDGSGRSIALFFYDGKLANAIAFGGALATSQTLADAVEHARPHGGALVQVATDGESYGHHFRFGDLTLAYALDVEFAKRGFALTNYATFLERFPPRTEVEIANGPDGTSWAARTASDAGRDCVPCLGQAGLEPDVARPCAPRSMLHDDSPALRRVRLGFVPRPVGGAPTTRSPLLDPEHAREPLRSYGARPREDDSLALLEMKKRRFSCTRAAAGSSTISRSSRPCGDDTLGACSISCRLSDTAPRTFLAAAEAGQRSGDGAAPTSIGASSSLSYPSERCADVEGMGPADRARTRRSAFGPRSTR